MWGQHFSHFYSCLMFSLSLDDSTQTERTKQCGTQNFLSHLHWRYSQKQNCTFVEPDLFISHTSSFLQQRNDRTNTNVLFSLPLSEGLRTSWKNVTHSVHHLFKLIMSGRCLRSIHTHTHALTRTNAHRIKTAWKTDISLSYMLFKGLCNIWWNTSFKTSLFVIFNTHVENVK